MVAGFCHAKTTQDDVCMNAKRSNGTCSFVTERVTQLIFSGFFGGFFFWHLIGGYTIDMSKLSNHKIFKAF